MGGATKSLGMIRRAALPALMLIIIGSFAGHAIAGPNGLLAWAAITAILRRGRPSLRACRASAID